jgi:hypothetical protein
MILSMRIFLSWSGDQSRIFAGELKPWLELVLSGTDVWLSSEDIDKGTIWFTEIIEELNGCNCGVICITQQNHLSPWIHFEAGGMVKGLGKSRVATILLDIDYPQLQPPLNQFNGTRLNRIGAWQLVKSLAKLSDRPYKDYVLEKTFDKFWPDLERAYQMLFPDSHRAVRDVEQPIYIAPAATTNILGNTGKRKRSKSGHAHEAQQGLFNGVKEE